MLASAFLLFSISSMAPKMGMRSAEIPRMTVRRKTMGDWRFHFFMTFSKSFMPAMEPSTHHVPVHAP